MYKSLRLLLILMLGCSAGSFAQTYSTHGSYSYTVPAGVTAISVNLKGAAGGLNSNETGYPDRQGYGACVSAILVVTPGQVLQVNVGGAGGNGVGGTAGAGGFNGGGAGSTGLSSYSGGGGGGRTDISFGGVPLVVAAGGGGAGMNCSTGDADRGGDGGGLFGGVVDTGEGGVGCGATGGGPGITFPGAGGIGGVCVSCGGSAGNPGTALTGGTGGAGSAGGGGGGGYSCGGGGQWSGGGGGANYFAPGVYFVSKSRGCRTSGDGAATISVFCAAGTITGPSSICIGSTYSYTESVGGGTWSTAFGYASIGTSGTVTALSAGVDTIYYTVSSGTPACIAKQVVSVNPLPAPITGPTFVCQGSQITLSDASAPAGSWSSTLPSIATINPVTGVLTGVSAGATIVSYTLPTGCASTYSILVNPVPSAITGPTTVCVSSTITLSDPDPAGTWFNVPGTGTVSITPTGTTTTVTGLSAGTVTISYQVGTCAATVVLTVNPLPGAIAGPSMVCMGSTATVTSTGGGTFTSGTTSVATIGGTTGVITPVSPGTTSICYTLPTGCQVCRTETVNAAPAAITTTATSFAVCQGQLLPVADPTGSGTWTSGTTGVATVTPGPSSSATVSGISGYGTSIITFTLSSTGCSVTQVVTVNALPTAISGPDPVCVGATVTEVSGGGAGTWSITGVGGTIVSTTGSFTGTSAGTPTITYTLAGTSCYVTRVMTVNPLPAAITGPTSVCVGSSITLSDATVGGTWSSLSMPTLVTGVGGSGTTTSVTGVAAGVATITYTLPTTCSTTYLVTVNATPATITGSVNQLCDGDSVQLNETSTGGTWTSSIPTVATVGSLTGMVNASGVTGGVINISYTFSPSGCYAIYPMTVSTLPAPFTPLPLSMCLNTASFNILSGGGAGTWTSLNTGIATVTAGLGGSGVIVPVSAGVDSICYTFTAVPNCKLCEQFTVNPIPAAITGPNKVCTGKTITVSDITGGGTWSMTNAHATITAGGIITGVTAGVDTVVYTNASLCKVIYTITVNTSPAAITFTTLAICQGQTLNLSDATASPPDGWTSSNLLVATVAPAVGTTTVVTGAGPGVATITYTVANGCTSTVQVTVSTLSTPITGPSMVCTGSTITLANAAGSGVWSSSVGTVASVTTPGASTTVTGLLPGTSVITFNFGGCQTSKTITVNLTPAALITPLGPTDLCPGGVVALTATTGVGFTYQWLNPGPIGGATGPTYTTSTAATYSVTIATAFCSATSPGVTVTMNPVFASIAVAGSLTACASSAPVLTASPGGMSYQWESSGVPITGAVGGTFTPTASGTYNVIVTNAFGCSGTATAVVVTLIPSPTATVTLSGPINFCNGDSVTMSTTLTSGNTYQWYVGGTAIAGATTTSYTAHNTGTYTLKVTNGIGCTTTSASIAVNVTAGPAATITPTGSTIFCAGGGVTLGANAGPGLTYQWYKNGAALPGATNISYLATTSGSYTVRVTSTGTGCGTMSAATVVTDVTAPLIQALTATTFCWGGSVTLAATVVPGAGPVTYQWYKNGVLIAGATNATYTATTTGNYSVNVTVTSAVPVCTVSSAATAVTEYPLPNPLVTYDGTYFHTGTFVTYQWYKNTVAISGATTNMTHNLGAGTYYVLVTDANGCQSASANYIIGGVGVNNTTMNADIKIYPNPAQTMVHIEAGQQLRAVVSGMDGRTVIDQADAKDISISSLANGLYLIKLYDNSGLMLKTEKLVKAAN